MSSTHFMLFVVLSVFCCFLLFFSNKRFQRPVSNSNTQRSSMFTSPRQPARAPSRSDKTSPRSAQKDLISEIKNLCYRRYAGDISRVYMAFNTDRDNNVDFDELLEGLSRIFWLQPDPQLLWDALNMNDTNGQMDLTLFAYYFGTIEEDISNPNKWSKAVEATATPTQDSDAAYRHLRHAQSFNPTRQEDITSSDLNKMQTEEIITAVLTTLESTELGARKLFSELDSGRDKKLDVNELCRALRNLGLPMTRTQTSSVMRMFDRDQDRKLSYSEFVRLLSFVQNQRDIENDNDRAQQQYEQKNKGMMQRPTTVREASRCSAARKQRKEISTVIGLNVSEGEIIDPLDYNLLERISNGIYSSRRKVRTLFKLMDNGVNGGDKRLDPEELKNGLVEVGVQNITIDHANALVKHFSNGEGSLRYSQFVKMLASPRK